MFKTCSQHVVNMFTTCSSHVHHILSHVHYMFITFSSVFTTCLRHVHNTFTTCSQHVHNMFTKCLQHGHNMFTTCPFNKRRNPPLPQPPLIPFYAILLLWPPKPPGQATKNTFLGFPDLLPLNNLIYKCVEKQNRFFKTHKYTQDSPSRFHAIPKPALRMRVW